MEDSRKVAPLVPGRVSRRIRLLLPGSSGLDRRFEVTRVVGSGRSSVVYSAFDREEGRNVALKVIRDPRAAGQVRHLESDAARVRESGSPFLLAVRHVSAAGGALCLTTDLVEPGSLRRRLEEGPLPITEALALATSILQGLAALHGLGLLHQNLKPENILLPHPGAALLSDWGMPPRWESEQEPEAFPPLAGGASPFGDLAREPATPASGVGTAPPSPGAQALAYLAPEEVLGKDVDHRADLYSFGIVLFEMLAGEVPLRRGSSIGTLAAQFREAPPDLRTRCPQAPRWLEALLRRLLAKDPDDRLASVAEVLAALASHRVPRRPFAHHHRVWPFVAALGAAFVVAAVLLPPWSWNRPRFAVLVRESDSALRSVDSGGRTLWARRGLEADSVADVARVVQGGPPLVAAILQERGEEPTASWTRRLSFLDPVDGRVVDQVALPDGSSLFSDVPGPFNLVSLKPADLDGDGLDELLVTYEHAVSWPAYTVAYEPRIRRARVVFASSGRHRLAGVADVDGDGRREVLLAGYNNRMGRLGSIAAVRVPARPAEAQATPALSPDRPAGGQDLVWYALVPSRLVRRVTLPGPDGGGDDIALDAGSGRKVMLGLDGFLTSSHSFLRPSARRAAREAAFAALRESEERGRRGAPGPARESIRKAADLARQAGDWVLSEWALRVEGRLMVRQRRFFEAQDRFESLLRGSESSADVALEAALAFHLAGELRRAVSWYGLGLVYASSEPSAAPFLHELLEGEVMALGEMGLWDEARVEIDRFLVAYPSQWAAAGWCRDYVRWRTSKMTEMGMTLGQGPDLIRYWALEFHTAAGGDVTALLQETAAELRRTNGPGGLLRSLEAHLLGRLGRFEEAAVSAEAALRQAEETASADTAVRAHLSIVRARWEAASRAARAGRGRPGTAMGGTFVGGAAGPSAAR